jgi:hypothetical protein
MMLRGSTAAVVDEMERGVEDALDVVATAAGDGRVVPGGGAVEMAIERAVRDSATQHDGVEQLAVEAFGEALANFGGGGTCVRDDQHVPNVEILVLFDERFDPVEQRRRFPATRAAKKARHLGRLSHCTV